MGGVGREDERYNKQRAYNLAGEKDTVRAQYSTVSILVLTCV